MQLGNVIKELRKRQGLTQKDLSEKCGISANALCTLERNEAFPTKETISRICAALSVPIPALLLMALTDEDIPEEKRVAFNALKAPMLAVLMPSEQNE